MNDNNPKVKTKSKAAMLLELESIKGLLLEEDDIPILQEVMAQTQTNPIPTVHVSNDVVSLASLEQADFFQENQISASGSQTEALISNISTSVENTSFHHANHEKIKASIARPALTKASGENPFLPEHIRSRLHGNNPPPLFAFETAKKIARSNRPTQQLGNTQNTAKPSKQNTHQQELINEVMDALLPELERTLRERLEVMSKEMLEILRAENNK